jgi:hypothetical protein
MILLLNKLKYVINNQNAKLARYSIFTYFHVSAVLHFFNSILFFFIVKIKESMKKK